LTSEASATRYASVDQFEFDPHNCFACGTLNSGGLGLVMHIEPGRSWTTVTLDRRFEGWEGVAHGGILCTILDEVMAWALVGADNWGVTARMSVDFRRPVEIGREIRAEGWTTAGRRRLVDTAGRIVDPVDGTILATATGRYVAASEARKQELRQAYGFRIVGDTPVGVAEDLE
jgi:acyl-coenzyme A thioesterase PaaI-like protein